MGYIDQIIERHGADPEAFRPFDPPSPDLLPYATLLSARGGSSDPALAALQGIYEWQNSPLVFLADGDNLADKDDLSRLRRHLAMRGDAPYLGLVRAGQLTIYRISLDGDAPESARVRMARGTERSLFPILANQRPGIATDSRNWITNVVLRLLAESIRELKIECSINDADAVSLVGRALFTRFLGDRGLLDDAIVSLGAKAISDLFDSPAQISKTCKWLDETFNGDFLPLTPSLLKSLPERACFSLGNILRSAPGGQLSLTWEEKWENLDFAHIPVGVLSQAHEQYLREYLPVQQRTEGCYYTPRTIANLMVSGAFHALRRDGIAHQARVLDPASGAGVFLISAFRQLVAERWRHDQIRPQTATLREILYGQISGFDINEPALRFAALGLYLVSIELDEHPEPVQKLRFEKLRGVVLHRVGEPESEASTPTLGSLGKNVSSAHSGVYDLVISNPPWASGTGLPEWHQVSENVARIARERCPHAPPPKLPNEVLDLPFLWRAMEWAKQGGQIIFALHARLLFERGECMPEARSAVFRALDVTGIVNGAELRQTKVWPEVSAPFCLLFACNRTPAPGAQIRFVSPHLESSLNGAGGIRVDASNAESITSEQIISRPEIFKVLFRGSQLDLEIYDRLKSRGLSKLGAHWQRGRVAGATQEHLAGNGYQRLRNSSRVRKHGDGKPGVSARYLWGLEELTRAAVESVLVNADHLTPFRLERIHDPRPSELFVGPKLIVHESPPVRTARIRATVADVDLIFNQSFYGYNANGHPDGKKFVRYLALVVGSKFALWFALMTSGKFGFERETVEMFIVDELPIRAFEELSVPDLEKIDLLFDSLVSDETESAWDRVDSWVASLCGLRRQELDVISDTLRFGLPYAANRKAAQLPPSPPEMNEFCKALASDLGSLSRQSDKKIVAKIEEVQSSSPWALVRVSAKDAIQARSMADWPEILRVADHNAATEVLYPDPRQNCVWIARLNQSRYWTRSQAHLVARRVAWEHLDVILGGIN